MNKRIALLKKACQRLDALLVTDQSNVRYLSGFTGTDSTLLIQLKRKRPHVFITDARFLYQGRKELGSNFKIELANSKRNFFKTVAHIFKQEKLVRVGFEAKSITYGKIEYIKKRVKGVKLIPTYGIVEKLRTIKSEDELKLIKKAVKIAGNAFTGIRRYIKPGVKESEISDKMASLMRRGGADSAFPIIVASGKRSAWPHAPASDRKFTASDAVTIDAGACFKGYNSDLTRVYFLGRINSTLEECFKVISQAKARAIRAIKPGLKISQLDRIARNHIEAAGFGKYFLHSLGHGIGLDVHETPSISGKNKETLQPGMVFTVEPGIYLPEVGGVRLEDMVLVTKTGHKVL